MEFLNIKIITKIINESDFDNKEYLIFQLYYFTLTKFDEFISEIYQTLPHNFINPYITWKKIREEIYLVDNGKYQIEIVDINEDDIKMICKLFADKCLDFPFKKYFIDDPKKIFSRSKNYIPRFDDVIYPYHYLNLHTYSPFYTPIKSHCSISIKQDLDIIVDIYQEEARLSIKQKNTESIINLWKNPKFIENILRKTFSQYGYFSSRTIRETIYQNNKEFTQFSASISKEIMELFNARKVLDFNVGLGEKLIGALAAMVNKYRGFDSNIKLKQGHDNIISDLGWKDIDYQISYIPFERFQFEENDKFDLVFTSPSYSNLQIDNNSNLFEDWIQNVLFVSIKKCWNVLEKNGYLLLHLSDTDEFEVVDKMGAFVKSLSGCKYLGLITVVGELNNLDPIWCFQKSDIVE